MAIRTVVPISRLGETLLGLVGNLVINSAEELKETAKNNAPVDTGTLRDSIVLTSEGVEAQAPYALYVELGTEKQQAQPFLGPSADSWEAIVKDNLDK